MGRAPCCDKANVKKGPWSPEEDAKLKDFIHKYGTGGNWIAFPTKAGLKRCGKSCRLRWLNYLRPNIKHGEFSDDEDRIICTLFASIGSRWSIIAAQLPGRTDNDIKNYWNTKLKKKLLGISPSQRRTHARLQHLQQQQQEHKPNIFTPTTTNSTPTCNISSLPPPPQATTPYLTSLKPFLSTPLDNIFSISQDVMTNYNTNNKNSTSVGSSVLMFGGDLDQSCCTSSDGSSNLNIDYDSYGAHQVSLYQSLNNNVFGDQSQLRPLSGATESGVGSCQTQKGQKGLFDEASFDVDQFEIEGLKQLISPINACNSNLFYDDPCFSSFKSMYY